MSYATTDDVAAELGRPSAGAIETTQWQVWLDRVERRIRRQFVRAGLDLDTQIDLDDPNVADVVDVEAAAVVRKIQNPQWGETSTTKSIDDGSVTRRREGASAEGDPLELLDGEWSLLLPDAPRRARAYSVLPS